MYNDKYFNREEYLKVLKFQNEMELFQDGICIDRLYYKLISMLYKWYMKKLMKKYNLTEEQLIEELEEYERVLINCGLIDVVEWNE